MKSEFTLEVWRMHPSQHARIIPADKTLLGEAPEHGLRYCGPFVNANKSGWWIYPPIDIDVRLTQDMQWEYHILSDYSNEDESLVASMLQEKHGWKQTNRMKLSFGHTAPNVFNFWTGCLFKTPPGWALHIRNPINLGYQQQPYFIQEAILETSWLRVDIWMNLAFINNGQWVNIRRDQYYPLAQIIPVREESYDQKWTVQDQVLSPESESAKAVFDQWNAYYHKKWETYGVSETDRSTYYKERKNLHQPPKSE